MKYVLLICCSCCISLYATAQPGRYSGAMKSLIGQEWSDSLPELKGWTFREGSMVSAVSDPSWFYIRIYQNGKSCIAVCSIVEDTSKNNQIIVDVATIKNSKKGSEFRSVVCRERNIENSFIVAQVYPGKRNYSIATLKAWRFNRDKMRFEWVNPKDVDCLNEGSGK